MEEVTDRQEVEVGVMEEYTWAARLTWASREDGEGRHHGLRREHGVV